MGAIGDHPVGIAEDDGTIMLRQREAVANGSSATYSPA